MKRYVFIAGMCLSILCLTYISAETVTVTVVQNENAPAIALQMSQAIEDEILGDYFNAGQIVSNTQVRYDGSHYSEKNFGIKEAAFGLSDYLVVINLQYGPGEVVDKDKQITYAELNVLDWRLVKVLTSEVLVEKSINVKNIKVMDSDPYKQSRIVAGMAANDSLQAIPINNQGEKH